MRRRLLEDTGFVPVAGADHTMIAVRSHLYEDVRVLLDKQTKHYDVSFPGFDLGHPDHGHRKCAFFKQGSKENNGH
jgi:hypothetical protein